MPYRTFTAADGSLLHKFERAPPGSQAAGKPIVSNTKMSLEAVFDKTKARPLKELMAESKAKKAAAAERYVSPDKYHTLVNYDWKVQEMKSAYPNGVMVSRLPNGYDTWRAATENELDKQLQKEVKTGFKDPAKVKAFSDALNIAITEGKEKQMNKNKGIAEIQATITAPKGTKAQLIEMIREMVTDPVDRLKLKMESKSKGDLETLYIKMKAIHDWYKKNRPGEGIDYI
jgi:hypothetical protein